ncbi:MAG: tRNA (guanosine(46)-N7)-methyltransferase TrmB [Planctomycetota bacterium]
METGRPRRVHPSGRLTFRNKVRPAKARELPLAVAGDEALDWTTLVPEGAGAVECEVGCGKGTFLVEAARSRPERFFVGVEAGPAYAEFCADRLRREGLDNAVLVADDARLFLADTVPEGALARLHVYYPDPWPKWRHRKRRLFGPEFPGLAARVLAEGGELLVATDNLRYFGEALAVLGAAPALRRDRGRERGYGPEAPGLAFGPTNFSRKYAAEGRTLSRAVFVRLPEA